MKNITQLLDLITKERDYLLNHVCKTIPKNQIHLPSSSHFDECFLPSNRNGQTLRSLAQLYQHGVRDAWNMGAVAVGATVYFGSSESDRQIIEVARAFEEAHSLGMATILWCYTWNDAFVKDGVDYHTSADITG